MKSLLASIRVILVILNTAFQISLLVIDSWINGKSIERNFKHRRRWARWSMNIIGAEVVEIKGNIHIQSALIISNHRTLLDPLIQTAFLDAFIIAKAEVSEIPVISMGAAMTGIIFVKREKLRSRLAAREQTEEILLSGYNVLVYAEGTTGTHRTTERFKPGTFAIAAEHTIPVIPVAIEYPKQKDYWYDKSLRAQIFSQIGAWKTKVKLRIGEPIYGNIASEIMKQTQECIDRDLINMQEGWSEVFKKDAD